MKKIVLGLAIMTFIDVGSINSETQTQDKNKTEKIML
jgi:hypothetical protein